MQPYDIYHILSNTNEMLLNPQRHQIYLKMINLYPEGNVERNRKDIKNDASVRHINQEKAI